MNRIACATVAFFAMSISTAAAAADGFYVGLDAGVTNGRPNDVDELVTFSSEPAGAVPPETIKYDDVFQVEYDRGSDVTLFGGYDFGWFRVEGELGQKRVGLDENVSDYITAEFLADLNGRLNRPPAASVPGSPNLQALTIADFQPSGSLKVRSAMLNGMFDVELFDALTLSGGGGIGRSFAKGFDDTDSAQAWQYAFGARYKLNKNFDLGLKYRYFNSGIIKLDHDPIDYAGNPVDGGTAGPHTVNALVTPDIEGQFRTRSVLLSLTYNIR